MKPATTTTPSTMMSSTGPMGHDFPGVFPWGTNYMPNTGHGAMMPWGMTGPYGGMMNQTSPFGMTPFGGFAGVNRDIYNTRNFMDRMWDSMSRNFSSELTAMPSRPASMMENYTLANPIHCDAEGNRWLNCCFDMRAYKPEEINVTLNSKERCLSIEATHEIKDSKDHYIKRHYSRRFYLPEIEKCDLSKLELKSTLNNEGLLSIEAALPKLSVTGSTSMTGSAGTTPINVKVL